MSLTLHIAGGAFELSEGYSATDVTDLLDHFHSNRMSFELANGGIVEVRVGTDCE